MRLWAFCLLAGCSASVGRPSAAPQGDGCGRERVRLETSCWSAEGTRWLVLADGPGGEYRFELELLAAGRVRARDHGAAGPASDEWFQEGPLLRVFLSDRFVEYRATISNGTVLTGEAMNVRGQRWEWRAQRIFGEGACAHDEARLPSSCMSIAGTRWELQTGGGAPLLLEFFAGGRMGRENERWEQRAETLRFTIGEREFVAQLRASAELVGTYSGSAGSGRFTAARVASIPPLVRP